MAKKTGATVEALSGLKSAAKLSGTNLEEVGGGLQKLSKAMFEAAGGSQKQSDLFKLLGVEVTNSSGKLRDSGEVMLDLAKKLDPMDSSTQAVACKVAGIDARTLQRWRAHAGFTGGDVLISQTN